MKNTSCFSSCTCVTFTTEDLSIRCLTLRSIQCLSNNHVHVQIFVANFVSINCTLHGGDCITERTKFSLGTPRMILDIHVLYPELYYRYSRVTFPQWPTCHHPWYIPGWSDIHCIPELLFHSGLYMPPSLVHPGMVRDTLYSRVTFPQWPIHATIPGSSRDGQRYIVFPS